MVYEDDDIPFGEDDVIEDVAITWAEVEAEWDALAARAKANGRTLDEQAHIEALAEREKAGR